MPNDRLKPLILIVDDTPANIKILLEALRDEYEIGVAIDGPKALQYSSENLPDLILLDILMPGMDGYEVCQQLKSDARTENIPVIFISGMGEEDDEVKGLELGAVDYIIRPFNYAIVNARVKTHIELKKHRDTQLRQTRLAKDAQKESERRFRAIFDQSFQFMGLTDSEGLLLEINATALDFIKADESDVLGKYMWETLWWSHSPNERERLRTAVKEAAAGILVRFQATVSTPQGNLIYIDFSLKPVKNDTGQVVLIIQEGRDITEVKEAQQQVYRAEKLAALGQIIAGIAHEINNPNNFIYFNLPVLRDYLEEIKAFYDHQNERNKDLQVIGMPYEDFFKDVFQLVADMGMGTSRISGIVSELKKFLKPSQDDDRKPDHIDAVIGNVVTLVGRQIRKIVNRFEVETAPDLPLVDMDAGKIEQVIMNLVLNAAQAADKEDAMILINAESADDGRCIVITIEDNGAGIPDDIKNKIFDPFFTTKGRDAGTGLGLSITQRIVEEHGGEIDFVSTVGKGTTFKINLPGIDVHSDSEK